MLMSVAEHLPNRCFLRAWSTVIEITGSKIRTAVRVVYNLPAIALKPLTVSAGSTGSSDLHLFGSLKKHLAGKLIATETGVKQAFTSLLQTLVTLFCGRIQSLDSMMSQMYKCQWRLQGDVMCAI